MDVSQAAALVSGIQNSAAQSRIDFAVAAKTLQANRSQGEAAVKLIEQAASVQSTAASDGSIDLQA